MSQALKETSCCHLFTTELKIRSHLDELFSTCTTSHVPHLFNYHHTRSNSQLAQTLSTLTTMFDYH